MNYWNHLLRVEITAILSLVLYAAALVAVLGLGAQVLSNEPQSASDALRSFTLVLWFSILPTIFLFAPIYAFLRVRRVANFALAIVVGIMSSAVLVALFRNGSMALYALPSGAFVGAATHAVMKLWNAREHPVVPR